MVVFSNVSAAVVVAVNVVIGAQNRTILENNVANSIGGRKTSITTYTSFISIIFDYNWFKVCR